MSQRPILLIDSDRDFHALLTRELGPYGFEIIRDDSSDALGQVAKLGAIAVVISVDEPDKKGYATFNKAKKTVAANLPVVLITSSVAPTAFIAHRKLKVHADEYLDKRELSEAELLGKFDNLIGLGDLVEVESEADLALPIEVDEVALDDDVVVDEVEQSGLELAEVEDFDDGGHTQASTEAFDDLIDAETDAAFAALTDAVPIEVARASMLMPPLDIGGIPEPIEAAEPRPLPEPAEADPVETIEEVDGSATAAVGVVEVESGAVELEPGTLEASAIDSGPVEASVPEPALLAEPPVAVPVAEPPAAARDEALDVEEPIESIDGLIMMETSASIPLPALDAIEPLAALPTPVAEAPAPPPPPLPRTEPVVPAPPPPSLAPTPTPMPPPRARPLTAPPPSSGAARAKPLTTPPVDEPAPFDLGLDEIAARADAEQSGVHDRRTLQKLHQLERDNQRLKAELDKAKTAEPSTTKPVSREREFLNLREMLASKDKELLGLRDEISHKDREVLDARERTRQLQHAKAAVESKNVELEARLLGDHERVEIAETAVGEAKARIGTLEARVGKLTSDGEAARIQHAESTAARRETEAKMQQLVASHQAATSKAEREHTAARDKARAEAEQTAAERAVQAERASAEALAALRTELAGLHAGAVAAISVANDESAKARADEHHVAIAAAIATERTRAREAVEAVRGELTAAHEQTIAAQIATHAAATANAQREAETALATAQRAAEATLVAEVARLAAEYASATVAQRDGHDEAIGALRTELEGERAAALRALETRLLGEQQALETRLVGERDEAIARAASEREQLAAAAAAEQAASSVRAASERDEAIAHAASERAELAVRTARERDELTTAAARERDELIARTTAERDQLTTAAAREREELIARTTAERDELIATTAREREELTARTTAERDELIATTAREREELVSRTAREREATEAKLVAERDALEARKNAELEALEARKNAEREEVIARGAAEREAVARRNAVERAEATAARDALIAQLAEAAAAREAVETRASQLEAGVADGQHQLADMTRQRDEVGSERSQLEHGLTSARGAIRRLDEELAAARSAVSDRDLALTEHQAAIAARDQRVTELTTQLDELERENATYQEQVLKAYQKIKTDEATVLRAKKALAIALTALDDSGKPPS